MRHREKETQKTEKTEGTETANPPKHHMPHASDIHERLAAHAAQRDAIRTAGSRIGPLRAAYRGLKA